MEPNNTFAEAKDVSVEKPYTDLNFVPPAIYPNQPDEALVQLNGKIIKSDVP
jgi:hypothetical protein